MEMVMEPRTGLQVPASNQGFPLVGTSARSVTFLGFLTYAFALYRDSGKWNVQESARVIDDLIQDPAGSIVRIVTYRAIDCTHFCSSINSGAVPRMKKHLETQGVDPKTATEEAELVGNEFRSLFKSKDLPVNTAVDFRISKLPSQPSNTRITIFINGEEQGHIDGTLFTNAFVALYFGQEPRSKEIQAGVQACIDKKAAQTKH